MFSFLRGAVWKWKALKKKIDLHNDGAYSRHGNRLNMGNRCGRPRCWFCCVGWDFASCEEIRCGISTSAPQPCTSVFMATKLKPKVNSSLHSAAVWREHGAYRCTSRMHFYLKSLEMHFSYQVVSVLFSSVLPDNVILSRWKCTCMEWYTCQSPKSSSEQSLLG